MLISKIRRRLNEIHLPRPTKRTKFLVLLIGLLIILVVGMIITGTESAKVARENKYKSEQINKVEQDFKTYKQKSEQQFIELRKQLQDQNTKIEQVRVKKETEREQSRVVLLQPVVSVYQPPVRSGVEQWRGLVAAYFPASQVNNALLIMNLESGGNPNTLSSTCDRGLMQINCTHADKVGGNLNALYDPNTNMRVAAQIYNASGWSPWSTARKAGLI